MCIYVYILCNRFYGLHRWKPECGRNVRFVVMHDICTYIYIYIYIRIHVHIYVSMSIFSCIRFYGLHRWKPEYGRNVRFVVMNNIFATSLGLASICVCLYVCVCQCPHSRIHTYACTYIYTCTNVFIHTYIKSLEFVV